MSLTTKVSRSVSSTIQKRGRSYYLRGAVRIFNGDAWQVRARVKGTRSYLVSLSRGGEAIRAECSCPYFQGGMGFCKHIWATLLAAEFQGYLHGTGTSDPQHLESPDDDGMPQDGEDGWIRGEWDEWNDPEAPHTSNRSIPYYSTRRSRRQGKKRARQPNWKQQLASLRHTNQQPVSQLGERWPAGREVLYVVDAALTKANQKLTVEVAHRDRKRDGAWGKLRVQRIGTDQIAHLPDAADRQILSLLVGAREQSTQYSGYYAYYPDPGSCRYLLAEPTQDALLPLMCQTGRCRLRLAANDEDLRPLHWEEGEPWEVWLKVALSASGKQYLLTGELRRGSAQLPLAYPSLIIPGGLVFWDERVAHLRDSGDLYLTSLFRQRETLAVPIGKGDELLKELLALPSLPKLELPAELRFDEVALTPGPRLKVRRPVRNPNYGTERLIGELSFDYDTTTIPDDQPGQAIYQADQRRLIQRDKAAERTAAERLHQLGFRPPSYYYQREKGLELAPRNLPHVVRTLLAEGWQVEAEGKLYRRPGTFHIDVSSGIDWFELHGRVEYGDTTAQLPELLAAVKRGEDMVRLDDGTFGLLPEEWLKKYGLLAGLGTAQEDHLRFARSQVGLLDALLASQPEATCDAVFQRMRDELRTFEGVQPARAPSGFVGELRGYQQDGLGWLQFLQRFGFGGCLADDMGLGKTVQVLALLEARRELRAQSAAATNGNSEHPGPSLVVVPRSLIFNWIQEAARFCPKLRVLDHTGIGRSKNGAEFENYDLVLTTYGTLRRDVLFFKELQFDYCILDEAQAIKNASSESAKSVRLLRGHHRLALSGTPVENHLGELWSLFEFLNPGMLGAASVFRLGSTGARNPDEETRQLLARALRPFILRRTKDQVAKDLPQKLEQTLYCELDVAQRRRYDELREHYRQTLLARIESEGMNKAKIQILEALLRLRQAACHPGLIDQSKTGEPSAKLDMLLPQLSEVLEEGHKILVFSQFTSLLAILRERLDAEKIPYEYLDGRTRNRQAKVEHFQNDPDCKLFLISLKAGGLGLNLTAAEYVFLLDPWWNPAVEAQAIDRAHRIGQTQSVFAYRLIARDTVEEKVLELQQTKRALADAIINADNSLVRNLSREDLQLLLS